MSASAVSSEKVVSGPILSVPAASMLTPRRGAMSRMEMSSAPGILPSRSFMSTSEPPAMTTASG